VIDATRPGRPTAIVNAVSREVGGDVAGWRWTRIVSFYGQLEREARQRPDA